MGNILVLLISICYLNLTTIFIFHLEADASVSVYTLINNEDVEQDTIINKNIYFTINDAIRQEDLTESTDSYIIQDDEIVYQLDSASLLNTNLKVITLNNEKFLCIATDEGNILLLLRLYN